MFLSVFADVAGDFHRAKGGTAHRAEMSGFGSLGGKGFVMEIDGAGRVESQGELVAPAELKAGLGNRVVAFLSGGMSFSKVSGVGGDLVSDDAFANVVPVGKTKVLFRGDVAEHGAAIPTDVGGSDT